MTTEVALARVDTAHDVGLSDHRVQGDVDPPPRRLRGRPMFEVDGGTPALGRTVVFELFFGNIHCQAIERGTFASVKDLIATITTLLKGWNDGLARRE
jgi:hypothetical protein